MVNCLAKASEVAVDERIDDSSHHMLCAHGCFARGDLYLRKMLCRMGEIAFHRRRSDGCPDEPLARL